MSHQIRLQYAVILIISILISSCGNDSRQKEYNAQKKDLGGELVIFHAGSLSVPLKEVADSFTAGNPGVKFLMESAGSVASARKLTDLGKTCDLVAVSDYKVIDDMLIPGFADWNIRFATNEMTIVFTDKSKYSNEINILNWPEILSRKDVIYGRSDPESDPCGYRTLMCFQLAEKYYHQPKLGKLLLSKDQEFIRPKEVDLIALLETHSVDYIFIYRSVAMQHKLKYLVLPDEINLKMPEMAELYSTASTEIAGDKPGTRRTLLGEPMIYGMTIPKNAPNRNLAIKFAMFLLDPEKGMKIMERNGQPSIIPSPATNFGLLPAELKKFAKE